MSEDLSNRESPWPRNVALWVAFLVVLAVGVVTVVMPELEHDPESDSGAQSKQESTSEPKTNR